LKDCLAPNVVFKISWLFLRFIGPHLNRTFQHGLEGHDIRSRHVNDEMEWLRGVRNCATRQQKSPFAPFKSYRLAFRNKFYLFDSQNPSTGGMLCIQGEQKASD